MARHGHDNRGQLDLGCHLRLGSDLDVRRDQHQRGDHHDGRRGRLLILGPGGSTPGGGVLPFTGGAVSLPILVAAIALLGLGAASVRFGSRRGRHL
jgi:hypothetical protein